MNLVDIDRAKFKEACQLVERACRQTGKDCQVIFTLQGVEIAPLSDAGSTTAPTLHEALLEALTN